MCLVILLQVVIILSIVVYLIDIGLLHRTGDDITIVPTLTPIHGLPRLHVLRCTMVSMRPQ